MKGISAPRTRRRGEWIVAYVFVDELRMREYWKYAELGDGRK